jgi:hypothetical protein
MARWLPQFRVDTSRKADETDSQHIDRYHGTRHEVKFLGVEFETS